MDINIFERIGFFAKKVSELGARVGKWYLDHEHSITEFLTSFANFQIRCDAIEKMAQYQIMFSEDISNEFALSIRSSDDVDAVVQTYFFSDNEKHVRSIIERCMSSIPMHIYRTLFSQAIEAYNRNHYHLACIGLFAIADGLLADVSEMDITGFKRRIDSIEEKLERKVELDKLDRKTFYLQLQLKSLGEDLNYTIFRSSHFSEEEPDTINRHWMMHGRTHREYNQYDFLKVILWIDQLSFAHSVLSSKLATKLES